MVFVPGFVGPHQQPPQRQPTAPATAAGAAAGPGAVGGGSGGVLSLERCDQPAGTKKASGIHRRKFRPKATKREKGSRMRNKKKKTRGLLWVKFAAAHL